MFNGTPYLMASFIDRLRGFKNSPRYSVRQTFIFMCESVIRGDPLDQSPSANALAEQIFLTYFMENFIDLRSDKIVNVRIHLAQTIAMLYDKYE